jgi:hypothetical protein
MQVGVEMCRNVVEGQKLGKFVQREDSDLRADIYKLKTRKLIEIKKLTRNPSI